MWYSNGLMAILCCLVFFAWSGKAFAQEQIIQEWGPDSFALSPDGYEQFSQKYSSLVIVDTKDQTAKSSWPYIHPGPVDQWANAQMHTFVLLFDLADIPKGGVRLNLEIGDTHQSDPPTIRVLMNGRGENIALKPGAGVGYANANEGQPSEVQMLFPPEQLRVGDNRLAITTLSGCWFTYRSLTLLALSQEVGYEASIIDIEPLPLYPYTESGPMATAQIVINNKGKNLEGAYVKVLTGDQALEQSLGNIGYGKSTRRVRVPNIERGTLSITLHNGDGIVVSEYETSWQAPRKWTIYLLHHSHTDLGYTNPQDEVLGIHLDNIRRVASYVQQTKDHHSESHYLWNVEAGWAMVQYLRELEQDPKKLKQLRDLVSKGHIGIEGLCFNELYSLAGLEELVRNILPLHQMLKDKLDYKPITAMLTDVPGVPWSLIGLLADAGIGYLDLAPNDVRLTRTIRRPLAFLWQSPDKKGEVLTFVRVDPPVFTYFEGNQVGFTDSLIGVEQALPEWLWRLEQLGYEYDLYPMRVQGVHPSGRYIDNTTASLQPSLIAKQWNEKYAYPKIVTATSADFYEDFRRAYKDQLPVVTGDLSDWWDDGVASSARETSLNRQARTMLPQAETLATLLGLEYPRLTTAYENLVLYHEHTWGSDNALPTNPVQQVIWREKARFAEDAFSTAQQVLQDSVAFLANKVCQNPCEIVVYNGNSQPMSGPVQVLAPKTNVHQVVDLDTHELHRIQWVTDDMFLFVAKEVPPLGYRRYALSDQKHSKGQESQPVTVSQRDGRSVLENGFFRLEVNNVGRVLSFYDKSLKKEWCDEGSSHGLGEYVYVLNQEQPIKTTSVTIEECGPLFATIAVYGQGIHHEEVVRRYSLWADLRQLDVSVELQKAETLNTEAAFVAFPLSIEDGKAAWQIPGAAVRYMQDQLPGSSLDYQSMQYWADISSDKMGLTLASKDAPLVWFNGYNLRQSSIRPLSAGAMTPVSSMYSFVMNNYWHVNYKRSQGGSLLFRYALRPHGGPLDSGEAHTFGSAFENPLQYAWSTKHGAGTPADSLLAFESAGEIVVVTCKLAQDGAGIVLRLVEVSGHGGVCRLGLGKLLPLRAWETSILEQPIDELSLVGHDLFLELLPFEVKTIYIELSR